MHRGLDFVCVYIAEIQKISFTICLLKDAVRGVMELRIPGSHKHRSSVSPGEEDRREGTVNLQLPARGKFRPAPLTGISEIFPNCPAHTEVFSP